MEKTKKILTGVLVSLMLASSVAFAANEEVKLPKGPIYQILNRISLNRLDMNLDEAKSHIQNRDLKETLEANNVNVTALQTKFRTRVNEFLTSNGIEAKVLHTDTGVQYQLSSENDNFLKRIGILQARAAYFNDIHSDLKFQVSVQKEGNTIYLNIDAKDSANTEVIEKIQDRIPESL
jgi:hypothetical protein